MWLNDYRFFSKEERLRYLSSQRMLTGIPYFGGKSRIGKYIYNAIFNMAVTMQDNGDSTKLFVDAFTGGGKMGLSMPRGWFDTIVINDLDYGVASYYRCAKDDYRKLLATINRLIDGMTEELYFVSLLARENREIDPLVAGAMTYLTAALSFNNIINYDDAEYKPTMGDRSEKEELDKVRARAQRTIQAVHNKLNSQEYIIENLDYRELIKKYNGLPFSNMDAIESYAGNERNILWYFDPPYYKYCLAGTNAAPYANSFKEEDTIAMTKVLSGEDKSCGELIYFIKSDYNPKETVRNAELALKSNKKKSQSETNTYNEVIKNKNKMMHVFDTIEKAPFYAFSVGKFDKGAIKSDGSVSVGDEWIWTKGFPNDYDTLEKVRLAENI